MMVDALFVVLGQLSQSCMVDAPAAGEDWCSGGIVSHKSAFCCPVLCAKKCTESGCGEVADTCCYSHTKRSCDNATDVGCRCRAMGCPAPPTQDFVAIGMVATATDSSQRPPIDLIRCVPKAWTRRAPAALLVYDGIEGTVWLSAHGLMHASKGRHAPQVYELLRDELQLS